MANKIRTRNRSLSINPGTPRYGFRRTDDIALKLGTPKTLPRRIDAGILYTLTLDEDEGHTVSVLSEAKALAEKILALDTMDAAALVRAGFDRLATSKEIIRFASESNIMLVALHETFNREKKIRWIFTQNSTRKPRNPVPDSVLDRSEFASLNERQRAALDAAFNNTIVVITGGAGTGKTFTIGAIATAYKLAGRRVALAALAGKAAQRIEEATGFPAKTIHRLLEYIPFTGFGKNGFDPIDADCVIIDEASMIDVSLFHALITAIDFDVTTLVFVGDHNQLPPVGAGYPFRDVIKNRLVPIILLEQCVRQAGLLKQSALALLHDGSVYPTPQKSRDEERFPWYVFTRNPSGNKIAEAPQVLDLIINLLTFIPREGEGLGFPLDQVQFLTATNATGLFGSKSINELIQKYIHAERGRVLNPNEVGKIQVGDRVIQTKNNYDLGSSGIFNGTMGIVREEIRSRLVVDFDGELVNISPADRNDLQLAYCLTVHKAQGSEFPCVVTVVARQSVFTMNRNWLYTAVTRAKKCSIIIGDTKSIQIAVGKIDADKRRTWLGHNQNR